MKTKASKIAIIFILSLFLLISSSTVFSEQASSPISKEVGSYKEKSDSIVPKSIKDIYVGAVQPDTENILGQPADIIDETLIPSLNVDVISTPSELMELEPRAIPGQCDPPKVYCEIGGFSQCYSPCSSGNTYCKAWMEDDGPHLQRICCSDARPNWCEDTGTCTSASDCEHSVAYCVDGSDRILIECTNPNLPILNCRDGPTGYCCPTNKQYYCDKVGVCTTTYEKCQRYKYCDLSGAWSACPNTAPEFNCREDGVYCCSSGYPYYCDQSTDGTIVDGCVLSNNHCSAVTDCGSGPQYCADLTNIITCGGDGNIKCCPTESPYYCERADLCTSDEALCNNLEYCPASDEWWSCEIPEFPHFYCDNKDGIICCEAGLPYYCNKLTDYLGNQGACLDEDWCDLYFDCPTDPGNYVMCPIGEVGNCDSQGPVCCPNYEPYWCEKAGLCSFDQQECDELIECPVSSGDYQLCLNENDIGTCVGNELKCCPSFEPYWCEKGDRCTPNQEECAALVECPVRVNPDDPPRFQKCFNENEVGTCDQLGILRCCPSGIFDYRPYWCEESGSCTIDRESCSSCPDPSKPRACMNFNSGEFECYSSCYSDEVFNCLPEGSALCCPSSLPDYCPGLNKCVANLLDPNECNTIIECPAGSGDAHMCPDIFDIPNCDENNKVRCCPSNEPFWCDELLGCVLSEEYCYLDYADDADSDLDGIADKLDNCVNKYNPTQLDIDNDGYGNACDCDFNNDGVCNSEDEAILTENQGKPVPCTDGHMDDPNCEKSDMDGNGIINVFDTDLFNEIIDNEPGPSCIDNPEGCNLLEVQNIETIRITDDTYVNTRNNKKHFSDVILYACDECAGATDKDMIVYLKTDNVLASVFPIASARLYIRTTDNNAATDGIQEIHQVIDLSWTERNIDGLSHPGYELNALDSKDINTKGTFYAWEVTSVITQPGQYAFAIVGTSSDDAEYRSRDTGRANERPYLEIISITYLDDSDDDNDGVINLVDNCVNKYNPTQLDVDNDGYGNACDCDFDHDGVCGFGDYIIFSSCLGNPVPISNGPLDDPTCMESDMDGDSAVGFGDFNFFINSFGKSPGPSALHQV